MTSSLAYAVIGVKNETDSFYLRWDIYTPIPDIICYAKTFINLYDKMEIWIVTNSNEKTRMITSSEDRELWDIK